MSWGDKLKYIPVLPLSALTFYIGFLLFWKLGVLPSPSHILLFLEGLYDKFGLFGLFLASFLEAIVYVGLYFPGSFVVAAAIILSDGGFLSLFLITLIVVLAVTIASFLNYSFGRKVSRSNNHPSGNPKHVTKGFILSMIHPNTLAFYFFNEGLRKNKLWKLLYLPFLLLPYVFVMAFILFIFKSFLKNHLDNPYLLIGLIIIWLTISFIVECKKNRIKDNDYKFVLEW